MLKGLISAKSGSSEEFKPSLISQSLLDEVLTSSIHLRQENPYNLYRKSRIKLKNDPRTHLPRWIVHDRNDGTVWTIKAAGKKREKLEKEFGALALCKKHENIVYFREAIYYDNKFMAVLEIPSNKAIGLNILLKTIHAKHGPLAHLVSYKEAQKRKTADSLKWTEAHVLYVCLEVLKALAHFHDKNIVHQDIRPENVVVDVNGGVKVSDALISVILTEENPLATTQKGTVPHYMSPEAVSGKPFDQKADMWTYGIFTLRVAENRIPFKKEHDLKKLFKKIFANTPARLTDNVGWSPEFVRMHTLCLQHNLTVRPSSAKLLKFKLWDEAMKKEDFKNYIANFTGSA